MLSSSCIWTCIFSTMLRAVISFSDVKIYFISVKCCASLLFVQSTNITWLEPSINAFHLFVILFPDARRRRRRTLVLHKKRRRLLPFIPTEDNDRRLEQMRSLATALTALNMEFSGELTYSSTMAPRSANQAKFEDGGMQVWTPLLHFIYFLEYINSLSGCRIEGYVQIPGASLPSNFFSFCLECNYTKYITVYIPITTWSSGISFSFVMGG